VFSGYSWPGPPDSRPLLPHRDVGSPQLPAVWWLQNIATLNCQLLILPLSRLQIHQFKSFHTGLFILHRRNSSYAPRYPLGDSESWQPSTARSLFRCPTQTLHCVFQNKLVLRTGRHNLIPVGTRFSTPVQTGPEAQPASYWVGWRKSRAVPQYPSRLHGRL